MSTIPLSELPTLTLLYKIGKLRPSPHAVSNATSSFNDKVSLVCTDITKLETDAIVNAANESLLGGGGVDGAIHRAAGPDLLDECATLDGCDTGSAKITDAYRLPCKKVIHAVGPVYWTAKREGMHTTLLRGCYTTSLDLAVENECTSIAFSALSTGVYGYPSGEAADTAIQAVKGWLEEDDARADKIERIVFCQFQEKDVKAYETSIPKYFQAEASRQEQLHQESTEPDVHNSESATVALKRETEPETEQPDPSEQELSDSSHSRLVRVKEVDLPDVPTTSPKEPDEPEYKKLKLKDEP